ncbi:MAG: hypothetical protein KAI71_01220 [Candidatus Pacebacteria bacterium]|nr:hypothetical protein [Candidatus Paceibacterota bacterium]
MTSSFGSEFINKKYPEVPKSDQVNSSVDGFDEARKPIKIIPEMTKNEKTDYWLEATENFHKRQQDNPESMEYIRNAFHNEYVIKPENIPESYFKNQ